MRKRHPMPLPLSWEQRQALTELQNLVAFHLDKPSVSLVEALKISKRIVQAHYTEIAE